MDVREEKSPSMAEPLSKDFAELRLSEEMSAPDLDKGAGDKDGAGFLSFMKGLLGNVVKLSSPTSPNPATPSEPNQASKEETRETLPSRVIETECKKATKEKQNEKVEQKETENEKVEKKETENEKVEQKETENEKVEKKETENEKVEQKETEKPAQDKGKEATAQSGGQKECKFYSKPGGCKYGGSCRFAHHLGKSDVGLVELNFLGLPIRPGKRECPFYMRTGNCKFSSTCRFHHPDPVADSARDATYGYSNGEAQKQNSLGASQMPTIPWSEPTTMNETIPFQDASPSYIPGLILPQCDDSGENTLDMSTVKGEKKNLCKKDKHARIEQMKVTLGLSDSQRTPTPGETLGKFYRRTSKYWQMTAHEQTQRTGNELGKTGFDLAKARYKEVQPILYELAIPEADQKAEEKAGTETSSVNPVGTSSRRKAGAEKISRKKIKMLETGSRKKAGAETSSREEVNSAETSSQKIAGAKKRSRKKVNLAEIKFQKMG